MDYKLITEKAIEIVKGAGNYIASERRKLTQSSIQKKGKNDFVTHVDKGTEEIIVAGLEKILPEAGFIAEEGTSKKKGEVLNWVIDPIDGTTNFIHGAPPYSISVGLMENEEIVIGIVYEVVADELFHTYKGAGSYLNNERIEVSGVESLQDSLVATGFPYSAFGRLEEFVETLDFMFHNSHGVRRLGSAAADLAYVACGRYDGFYEYNLKPWDVAAGILLVKNAGGKISDFEGNDNYIFGGEMVASNAHIFNEFQHAIGGIMNKKNE